MTFVSSPRAILNARECGVVADRTCLAFESALLELEDHEDLLWHVIFATETEMCRLCEAEAWIVFGVAEHNDRAEPEWSASAEALVNERRADALALACWHDRHRRKPD